MKKDEFFKILNRRLSVIEDSERNDILEEYRQHIEMKMHDGNISEEEAIEDFGDVNTLADEILSAYHVRTKTSQSSKAIEIYRNVKKEAEPICSEAKSFWSNGKDKFLRFFKAFKLSVGNLFKREKAEKIDNPSNKGEKQNPKFLLSVLNILKTLFRWFNNLIFGGLSILTALIWVLLLVCLGMLFVLSIIGYPFWGMTVAALGLLLVLGALAVAEYFLIKRNPKKAGDEKGENENA